MTDLIKERAKRIEFDEVVSMMEVARDIRMSESSRPDQVDAANAVKRSIHSLDKSPTPTKIEVLRVR